MQNYHLNKVHIDSSPIFSQITAQLYKYQSNTYKEQFLPISADLCLLISGMTNIGQNEFSQAFFSTLGKSLMDIVYDKGNEFPRSCPMQPVLW